MTEEVTPQISPLSRQSLFDARISSIMNHPPLTVAVSTSIRTAVEIMVLHKIGSVVVVDADGHPLGIFTQTDVLRRVVFPRVPESEPLSAVMSTPLVTLPDHASVYDAMLAMAERSIRHIVLVDVTGKVCGVASERDLFALHRTDLRTIGRRIDKAKSANELREAAADVRQLGLLLLEQGLSAEKLTQLISGLNDRLTRRLIRLVAPQYVMPNVRWAWLAFGSEGRDEQTFSTDQDNGIVFECPLGAVGTTRATLLAFAGEVNTGLAGMGFPLCKGNIMASNPQWCLTLEEWQAAFTTWIGHPQPDALLNASIFFDLRALCGEVALVQTLQAHLLKSANKATLFLRLMAENALKAAPPLGAVRDFRVARNGEFRNTLDLKANGARIFVDAARIFALATGIANTGTVPRLRAIAAQQGFAGDDVEAMVDSFFFIQQLRLRHQHGGTAIGAENRINPAQLNDLDRRVLKEAFRHAKKLQSRLQLEYRL